MATKDPKEELTNARDNNELLILKLRAVREDYRRDLARIEEHLKKVEDQLRNKGVSYD